MPEYTATFTIHLTLTIKAKDHEAAAEKAEVKMNPVLEKLESQMPKGVDWELNDYNPEINEV